MQVKRQQQTVLRTGEYYKTPKTCFAYPGNETEYVGFRPFEAAEAADECLVVNSSGSIEVASGKTSTELAQLKDVDRFLFSVSTATPFNDADDNTSPYPYAWEPKRRPMSSLVFLIDSPPEVQSYTFTVRGTYYTRWPMEHVLGQHHPPIPHAHPGVVSHIRDAGEHFGQVMHDLSETVGSVGRGIARGVNAARSAVSTFVGLRDTYRSLSGTGSTMPMLGDYTEAMLVD
jgi:hypothetical protein